MIRPSELIWLYATGFHPHLPNRPDANVDCACIEATLQGFVIYYETLDGEYGAVNISGHKGVSMRSLDGELRHSQQILQGLVREISLSREFKLIYLLEQQKVVFDRVKRIEKIIAGGGDKS